MPAFGWVSFAWHLIHLAVIYAGKPAQVVLAHPPHRCSPSSGDRQLMLFVTGYSRCCCGVFQGEMKFIFDFNKIVTLVRANFYNVVGWVLGENITCQVRFSLCASTWASSSRICASRGLICWVVLSVPRIRKSTDTFRTSDTSISRSTDIPLFPISIFPKCGVLIFNASANCSCVSPRSFRISFRRHPKVACRTGRKRGYG